MRRQSQRCHLTSFSMLSLRGTRQYLFHSRRTRDAAVDLNTGYLRSRRDLKDYVIFRSERFFFWREKVTFVLWMGCFELVSLLVWDIYRRTRAAQIDLSIWNWRAQCDLQTWEKRDLGALSNALKMSTLCQGKKEKGNLFWPPRPEIDMKDTF